MSRPTSTICKFIGTISLGLLTGVSYSTSLTTLPPLRTLPSAYPASVTFQRLRFLTTQHQLLLSSISSTTLLLAYALSPPRRRHPYLLWAVLAIGVGYAREVYGGVMMMMGGRGKKEERGQGQGEGEGEVEREGGERVRTPESSDEEWEVEGGSGVGGLNGEAVREGMERWRGKMVGRTAVWGVGWLVTVIGLWGDKGGTDGLGLV